MHFTRAAESLLKTEAQKILDQVRLAKRGLQAFDQLQRGDWQLLAALLSQRV